MENKYPVTERYVVKLRFYRKCKSYAKLLKAKVDHDILK